MTDPAKTLPADWQPSSVKAGTNALTFIPAQSQLGLWFPIPLALMTKPAIFSPLGQHWHGNPGGALEVDPPEESPLLSPDNPELPPLDPLPLPDADPDPEPLDGWLPPEPEPDDPALVGPELALPASDPDADPPEPDCPDMDPDELPDIPELEIEPVDPVPDALPDIEPCEPDALPDAPDPEPLLPIEPDDPEPSDPDELPEAPED
jgi:hypothetical protein